jgi:hypothetical protein
MENDEKTFRELLKTTGKVLTVIGLTCIILMLFFRIWPSMIYFLILLTGIVLIKYSDKIPLDTFIEGVHKSMKFCNVTFRYDSYIRLVKILILSLAGFMIITATLLIVSDNYFKKINTEKRAKEVISEITKFKNIHKHFPASLNEAIGNDPTKAILEKDSWGNNFIYKHHKNTFSISSCGSDGILGTTDDIQY